MMNVHMNKNSEKSRQDFLTQRQKSTREAVNLEKNNLFFTPQDHFVIFRSCEI